MGRAQKEGRATGRRAGVKSGSQETGKRLLEYSGKR
jgi:hypothetical protein